MERRRASAIALAVVACALIGSTPAAYAAKGDTVLLSAPTGTDATGNNGDVSPGVISADGRYVAWTSDSDNLAANDNDAFANVYLRDVAANTTTLVSAPNGATDGSGNNGHSNSPSISGDGRYVAFASSADGLVTNDNNAVTNVYVRDMLANTTTLVSAPTGSDGSGNDGGSAIPSISANGRMVAFHSFSNNLSANDNDTEDNIYVRDVAHQTTELVSAPTGTDGTGNDGPSINGQISADGQRVAFDSIATNLSTSDHDDWGDVFLRDLGSKTTTLVSTPTGNSGLLNNFDTNLGSISADGRYIGLYSNSDNFATNDNDAMGNLYLRDVVAETTTLVSLPTGTDGTGNNAFSGLVASVSADGRYVAFDSQSDNLAANDNDAVTNAYVRDVLWQTTTLVSLPTGNDGTSNNSSSLTPRISADGRYATFVSFADNMSANDNDAQSNVFRRTVLTDPPRNVRAPRLTGEAVVGNQLACDDGLWTDGTTARQWQRDGAAIGGQTGTTYALAAADAGRRIDCVVTAQNADGTAVAHSDAVVPIQPLQGAVGATGAAGAGGADGPVGLLGPTGPIGPRGPAGTFDIAFLRRVRITCKPAPVRRGKVKVTCRLVVPNAARARVSVHAHGTPGASRVLDGLRVTVSSPRLRVGRRHRLTFVIRSGGHRYVLRRTVRT